MKWFISWSGSVSLKIALVLRDWIPDVIRGVETFVSNEEIRKGKRWPQELANALGELKYGIICLTPANLSSPWIYFEAGALSKSLGDDELLAPILFGIESTDDVPGPLQQFQATKYEFGDIKKMMWAINERAPDPMEEPRFTRVFRTHWKELKPKIDPLIRQIKDAAAGEGSAGPEESPTLTEILDLVRSQQRVIERATGDPYHTFRGNSRLEPLSPGDYRQLAVGLAMLKTLAYIDERGFYRPEQATVRTLIMLRDPLEVILARAYAPHIHSLYFVDEGGPLRITYTEEDREEEESFDNDIEGELDDESEEAPVPDA
jgi:hypothetical protein